MADGGANDFPDTRWSRLLLLRDREHPRHREHLEGLVDLYWRPAYHYVRAVRHLRPEEAEDVVQQFFAQILDRGDLARLSPERGSFRGFFKTALKRFLIDDERRRRVRMPGNTTRLFRFEEAETQVRLRKEALTPEDAFDREWARGILTESMSRLRQALEIEGKSALYAIFSAYCLEGNDADVSYESLAKEHGMSLDDVRNGLRSVRQRGREILREMLSDYLFPGEDLEAELRFILSK
jgi:RNA polymerase sigma factor (sigma-70 family)